MTACNVRRIGDVKKSGKGVYLFNYFVGDDLQVVLQVWEYLAGWYQVETGLDNSILLAPLEGQKADYTVINYAHWEIGLLGFLWDQFSKKSFRSYMQANLEVNRTGSMPVLYRLA
jgi:hypothetical protein